MLKKEFPINMAALSRNLVISIHLILVGICPAAYSAEIALLHNGFTIRHEHRAVVGENTRLFLTGDDSSFVDIPSSSIERYEHDDTPASPQPATTSTLTPLASQSALSQTTLNKLSVDDVVNAASGRYRLDPDLVNSVIRAESGFKVRALSRKGAQGLMQLMPQTASTLGVNDGFNPQQNVDAGTRYLRELLERYNFDLIKALAAYNAGPARVEQYGGVPPYQETRAYVRRIVKDFNHKKAAQQKASPQQRLVRPISANKSH